MIVAQPPDGIGQLQWYNKRRRGEVPPSRPASKHNQLSKESVMSDRHRNSQSEVGKVYWRLTVVEDSGPCRARWCICRCECGTVKKFFFGNVRSGKSKSCGCLSRELARGRATHGHERGCKKTPELKSYRSMIRRCSMPAKKDAEIYKGITVCERWSGTDGFANFLADMGLRPSILHSIDRIKGTLGYSPENCRWATKQQQARNRKSNRPVTINGETHLIVEWCEILGIKHHTVYDRLRDGWPIERALTAPVTGNCPKRPREGGAPC